LRQESNGRPGRENGEEFVAGRSGGRTHLPVHPVDGQAAAISEETRGYLRGLEKLFSGRRATAASVVEQLREIMSGEIYNMYVTETTIWSTMQHCGRRMRWISIGRPFGSNQVYVLDRGGNWFRRGRAESCTSEERRSRADI